MSYEWLLTPDAAEAINCHPATLANWRYQRRGPPFERRLHHGHMRIMYRRDRLIAWARRVGIILDHPRQEPKAQPSHS